VGTTWQYHDQDHIYKIFDGENFSLLLYIYDSDLADSWASRHNVLLNRVISVHKFVFGILIVCGKISIENEEIEVQQWENSSM